MSTPSPGAGPTRVAGPGLAAAAALLLLGGLGVALENQVGLLVSNVGVLLLAVGGALGCLRAASRSVGATRTGWSALAVACGSWAVGQAVWTVFENVLGLPTPYPSVADVGYLGFPIAALVGLILLAPRSSGLQAPRRVLDGLMVGCALGLLAWLAVPSRLVADSAGSPPPWPATVVAVAYPLADIVLLTVAVLTVAQSRDEPARWALLGAAVLGMAASDITFAYQFAVDDFRTGTAVEWGWRVAFALLATAGLAVGAGRPAGPARSVPATHPTNRTGLLPYLPLTAAAVVAGVESSGGAGLDTVAVVLIVTLVLLVLARQYLTVRENQELARTLQQREVQLHHLAFHDGLTGLANRALFLDRLAHALDLAGRHPRSVSVAFLDLDGFKAVNDALGHGGGDALLVRVAERLRGSLRTADTLARLGGDEFAVLIEEGEDAGAVAHRLLAALDTPFHIEGRTVGVSASIGVATVEPDPDAEPARDPGRAATLLHRADVAMYAVKNAGKGDVLVHFPALDLAGRRDEPGLKRAFAAALDRGDVRAVYQPVVDLRTGRIMALEALARWTHGGVEVPPSVFVPICEQAGLSERLTALMLEQACAQLAVWNHGLGHRGLRVAVNVNPTEFSDAGLPDRISDLLGRHRLGPDQLALEMTEVALSNRPDVALDVMGRLRNLGVRLALDDFGTGYSTLARLASAPVDTVKIDRFFVTDIDHDADSRRFLAGLLELTRHLGLRTIAEGVERPGQLRGLRELGCDYVQGHFVARPATPADLTALVLAETSLLGPRLFSLRV